MRVVVQRVRRASVTVDSRVVGRIDAGLLLLVGIRQGDDETTLRWMAEKVVGLRIFPDQDGRLDRSVVDTDGAILAVSQFTLYGDCSKGRRPSFTEAAPPGDAAPLFDRFVEYLRMSGCPVETGEFGAMMDVESVNAGPVTLVIDR